MHFDSNYYCSIKNFEGILRILEDLYVFSTAWYLLHENFIVPGIRFGIAELTEAEKKALGHNGQLAFVYLCILRDHH